MSKLRSALVAGMVVVAAAAFAPAAQAAPCDGKDLEQPFLDFNDKAFYGLAPGGDFESGLDGYELTGDAALTPGGNPFRQSSSDTALKLNEGSSVTTPPICVTKHNPSARIFGKTVDEGRRNATLKVEVLYLNADGSVRKVKKTGTMKNTSEWDATRKFSLAQGQFRSGPAEEKRVKPQGPTACEPASAPTAKPCGDKPGDETTTPTEAEPGVGGPAGDQPASGDSYIQLRFTPLHNSAWKIDDVFVDPRRYS